MRILIIYIIGLFLLATIFASWVYKIERENKGKLLGLINVSSNVEVNISVQTVRL